MYLNTSIAPGDGVESSARRHNYRRMYGFRSDRYVRSSAIVACRLNCLQYALTLAPHGIKSIYFITVLK